MIYREALPLRESHPGDPRSVPRQTTASESDLNAAPSGPVYQIDYDKQATACAFELGSPSDSLFFGGSEGNIREIFDTWLALPLGEQREFVCRYLIQRDRVGREHPFDLNHFRSFSPYPETAPETRLFLCGVEANLAILRAERAAKEEAPTAAGRVVLELIRQVDRQMGHIGLSLKTAAFDCRMSRNHIGFVFKRVSGMSFRKFLLIVRIVHGARLRYFARVPIRQIAASLGYSGGSLFSSQLRCVLGLGGELEAHIGAPAPTSQGYRSDARPPAQSSLATLAPSFSPRLRHW